MSKNFFKNKSIIIFFSLVISFNLLGFFTFLLLPSIAQAQTEGSETYCRDLSEEYVPMGVYIPGVTIKTKDGKGNNIYAVKNLACYLYGFYKYFAGVVGILAAVMIIYGGFKWLTSFGNPSRISAAKDQISSAVIGLLITLCTYIFLYTINPSIVNMKTLVVSKISPMQQRFTIWCSEKEGDKTVEGGTKQCGNKGVTLDGQKCIWGEGCEKGKELCGSIDGKYVCAGFNRVCEKTDPAYCDETDKQLVEAGVKDKVCRPIHIYINSEEKLSCTLSEKLLTCGGDWKRVDCNIGEGSNTKCWENGEPKNIGQAAYTTGVVFTCVDEKDAPRAGVGADAICCGKDLKKYIDCRDKCNNDEVRVSCAEYTKISEKDYQSGGTNNGCDPIVGNIECYCSKLCCMEIDLTAYSKS